MSLEETKNNDLVGEQIKVEYVPVEQVVLWEDNPKKHVLDSIKQSIIQNGFRDPPTYDETLGALVEGNGRATTLKQMEEEGVEAPRGILVHEETGQWYMPINFGINAETREKAVAYAIDHNNLTMAGGNFTSYDLMRMWDFEEYKMLLADLDENNTLPVSISPDEVEFLISDIEFDFDDDDDDLSHEPEVVDDEVKELTITVTVLSQDYYNDVYEAIADVLSDNIEWETGIIKNA